VRDNILTELNVVIVDERDYKSLKPQGEDSMLLFDLKSIADGSEHSAFGHIGKWEVLRTAVRIAKRMDPPRCLCPKKRACPFRNFFLGRGRTDCDEGFKCMMDFAIELKEPEEGKAIVDKIYIGVDAAGMPHARAKEFHDSPSLSVLKARLACMRPSIGQLRSWRGQRLHASLWGSFAGV